MLAVILSLQLVIGSIRSLSYNQPKYCASATWNRTGLTFANSSRVGTRLWDIFVDRNNTVYVNARLLSNIMVWPENSSIPTRIINTTSSTLWTNTLFVTDNGDIYRDSNDNNTAHRIDKWTWNDTMGTPVMYVDYRCSGLTVDMNGSIYCSLNSSHRVVKRILSDKPNVTTTVAGNGTAGAGPYMLHDPRSIVITFDFNLYVADCGNNRVQLFRFGDTHGITIVSNQTIDLNCPTGLALDYDGHLFLVDSKNHRIIGSSSNGYRCIVGCDRIAGSAMDQLFHPRSLHFDSYGNLFVADAYNDRIQKFFLASNSCGIAHNQPKLSPCATWNPNGTTFANQSWLSTLPIGLFVDRNNTVYATNKDQNSFLMWSGGSGMITSRNINGNFQRPHSMFVTANGDVYVDDGEKRNRTVKWTSSLTVETEVMMVRGICFGLFVDIHDNIYCSNIHSHLVLKRNFDDNINKTKIVAGTGAMGNASNMLSAPRGIFVNTQLDLYVADSGNDRIQLFRYNQLNATTVVGNGAPGTINLNNPMAVIVDADGYLFISDAGHNRIVSSGPYGYRCIVGCTNASGPASYQLSEPRFLAFDTYGNIYVADAHNNRIQKFLLKNDSCMQTTQLPSTMLQSTMETSLTKEQTSVATSLSITATAQPGSTNLTLAFIPPPCTNSGFMGSSCNISNNPCHILRPCQNNGTCMQTNSSLGYACLCPHDFYGNNCEFERKLCQSDTCLNGGTCLEISNTTYQCHCPSSWQGTRCQDKVDLCRNITCFNQGVCRPLINDYRCECLGESYSGRYCEHTSTHIFIRDIISQSFAYVAIIVLLTTAIFIVGMDILKYCFGIDPVPRRKRKPKRKKKMAKDFHRTVGIHFIYINAS